MKTSRFIEEQIVGIFKEQETGLAVAELCRKHGISSPTLYKWKARYGGLDVSEARKLKALEDEPCIAPSVSGRRETRPAARPRKASELAAPGALGGRPLDAVAADAEAMPTPRKRHTHLPHDALPVYDGVNANETTP